MRTAFLALFFVLKIEVRGQFTASETGCRCAYNTSSLACACCHDNGCQCPLLSETSARMCVECGSENQCPSALDRTCNFVNTEGCFIADNDRYSFSDAGVFCAREEGHLPNIKQQRVYQDIRDYATEQDWGSIWSGARIRDFDWQWSRSLTHTLLQGCFSDFPDSPNLAFLMYKGDNVTAENCIEECRERDYKYAGVQFETVAIEGTTIMTSPSCRCDNDQGVYSGGEAMYMERPLSECGVPCVSNETTAFPCGQHNKHLIFRIGGLDYQAWDESDMDNNKYCAMLRTSTRSWLKANCSTSSNHICEYPELSQEDCNSTQNYLWMSGRCVSIHTDARTWHDATRACGRNDGFLVQVDNENLNADLSDHLSGTDDLWWIGLTNRQLTWTDGSAVTTMSWATDEPDIGFYHDMCVVLSKGQNYRGKMRRCSERNHVICQLLYGWTDSDYDDYINYYETVDDSDSSDEGGGSNGGGNNNDNPPPSTPETPPDDNRSDSGEGSGDGDIKPLVYILAAASVVIIFVVLFVIVIIRQRKLHMKNKTLQTQESKDGFSGPGLDRGDTYKLSRQDSVYEKIDDTYERFEGPVANGVPASYAGLNREEEGYAGLSPEYTQPKEPPTYQDLTDPNAPALPPRPEPGYSGLTGLPEYTVPSPYTWITQPQEVGYAGLQSKHIEGATVESTYASTGETVDESTDTEGNQSTQGQSTDNNQAESRVSEYLEVLPHT